MKFAIIGLGNPGKKYEQTRHNAGFLAIDAFGRSNTISISQEKHHALIGKGRIDAHEVLLAKPQTYMNESGRATAALLRETYCTPADLIVLHDELDLPFGSVRVKTGGGHGGHNGLRSIIEYIGTADFIRVRIGIGRPAQGMDAAAYVLSPFSSEERPVVPDVMERAADAVSVIMSRGISGAMNLFNQK